MQGVVPGMGMGAQTPAPVYDPVTGQMIMPQGQLPMAGAVQYDAQGVSVRKGVGGGQGQWCRGSC